MTVARLAAWLRRHPIAAFPVVYLGWAYAFWLPVLASDASVWEWPQLLWFLVGGASPLLAGIGLSGLAGGRERIKDIFTRLIDWRRISGRWWIALLGFWVLFDLAMAGIAIFAGVTTSPVDPQWDSILNPSTLAFLLLLSFVFPAVEEIGLRGHYLDALQSRMPPVAAALVNGVVWAAWHTPFVWFAGYYANTSFQPELSWWLPMIVCHTVLIAWVYNHTRRSILAVLVFHGMMNFTGEWLRISADMYPFMLVGTAAVALLAAFSFPRNPPESV